MSGLPRGWVEATLDDFCAFENGDRGKNYSGRSTFVASGVPFISAGHLNNGHIDWKEMNYIPQTNYDRLGSGKVKSGDFLFCLRGSLGKHAFVPKIDAAAIASSLVIVRPSQLTDCKFVDYYFRSPLVKSSIEVYSNGVAQPNLSSANLGRFDFPLPPLAEQKRIVAKLDALNGKSARARTELARIETLVSRYKQAVLSKAFRGELTREWRKPNLSALPGSKTQTGLSLGDSERGVWSFDTLPEQWEWRRFDDMFIDITDGKRKLPQKEYLSEGPYPVVDQGITKIGGYTDQPELLHPAEPPFIVFGDHTRSVKYIEEPFVQGADGVKVFHSAADVSLSFAFLALSAVELPNKGYSRHMKFVRSTIFPVAPLEEQREIVCRIESAFAMIDRLAKETKRALELVGRLDEAILAKAFRGELVPQDESDEPAEKLLERIRMEREASPKVVSKRTKRVTTMPTARDFLNTKLENWPADGTSFQDLKREFGGNYEDLKEALFASLSDAKSPLQQIFDDKTLMMTFRKRER